MNMRSLKKLPGKKINAAQEKFCRLYASSQEFFGNGVRSYCEAYGKNPNSPAQWNVARSVASELLTNPNVCARITELLETQGWNDQNADKQALFMLNQFDNLPVKLGTYKEYNAIKRRVERPQMTVNILSFEQHLHTTNRAGEVQNSLRTDKEKLSGIQKLLPENTDQGIIVNSLPAQQSPALPGVQDQGTGEEGASEDYYS